MEASDAKKLKALGIENAKRKTLLASTVWACAKSRRLDSTWKQLGADKGESKFEDYCVTHCR